MSTSTVDLQVETDTEEPEPSATEALVGRLFESAVGALDRCVLSVGDRRGGTPDMIDRRTSYRASRRRSGGRGNKPRSAGVFGLGACLLGSVLVAGAPPAFASTTFVVNTTVDARDSNLSDGVCRTAAGRCSLRAAVQQANAVAGYDAITVPAGHYVLTLAGSGGEGGDLDVTDDLDINGAGAGATIIDGNGTFGVFEVGVYPSSPAFTVSMNGLTITGGFGSLSTERDSGAGLQTWDGTSVYLYRVTVSDNRSGTFGAGILNQGYLSLYQSSVLNNHITQTSGGGVTATGGGIFNFGTMDVYGSTIAGNTAIRGGGVSNQGSASFTNSTISGNRVAGAGGGIRNSGDTATVRVNFSTIANNSANDPTVGCCERAPRSGGGIYSVGAAATVSIGNSILAGNTNNYTRYDTDYAPDCYSTMAGQFVSHRDNLFGIVTALCAVQDVGGGSNAPYDFIGSATAPVDPGLAARSDNGGPTWTQAISPSSLAYDGDVNSTGDPFFSCPSVDQRGQSRPVAGACDMGSFEYAPPPGIRVNDVSVTEGNSGTKTMTFSVTLSAPSALNVFVYVNTANGTARSPGDYVALSGYQREIFTPGQLLKRVKITINGDRVREPNEWFSLNLSSATNGTIVDSQGIGTIRNDD